MYNTNVEYFVYSHLQDMVVKGNVHCNKEQQLLNANLDIDVFAKKSQKITIAVNVQNQELPEGRNLTSSVEVNSRGQQLKLDLKSHLTISTKQIGFGNFFTYNDVKQKPKTLGALFSADTSHVYLFVTLPDKELIKDDWKLDISKNKQKIYRELSLLGEAPRVMSYEGNNLNPFKFEAYFKGKLDILTRTVPDPISYLARVTSNRNLKYARQANQSGCPAVAYTFSSRFRFTERKIIELIKICQKIYVDVRKFISMCVHFECINFR